MFTYFTDYLRSSGQSTEQIASFLLVHEISAKFTHLSAAKGDFALIFSKINDVPALFKSLKDTKLKEEFLHNIKLYVKNWAAVYKKLFPYALFPSIISALAKEGYEGKLTALCGECFDQFRDNREAVVYFYKNSKNESWFKAANISVEKQLITLIHILDLTFRDIENSKDTAENKKINKHVHNILFKDGALAAFLSTADEDTVLRLFAFINGVKDLDPQDKINLKSVILDKHPDIKFLGDTEKKASRGLWVTMAMFEEKKKQLAFIMDEEVPANSKEIEYALSLGDLRENAEYKAAKEKQEHLNSQLAKLKEEIERAQIFDFNSVNTQKISFGTKVVLKNETEGKQEEYTILGPWESDPDNNIISYLSPFGSAILNKTAGEKFVFDINDERLTYFVETIDKAVI